MPLLDSVPVCAAQIAQATTKDPASVSIATEQWTQILTILFTNITTNSFLIPALTAPPSGGPCVGTVTIT